jgi:hypothetical protein
MDVTYHGITRRHQDWAEFCGVSEQTMRWRLAHWGVERALSEPKVTNKTGRIRRPSRKLTDSDKALICTAYIEGRSEDCIAGLIGRSRKQVSKVLKQRGLKIGGKAPERVVALDDTTGAHIHIHIHTDA